MKKSRFCAIINDEVMKLKKEFSPRYGLLIAVIGFVMAFLGYFRGEASVVFINAVRICLECIGIG